MQCQSVISSIKCLTDVIDDFRIDITPSIKSLRLPYSRLEDKGFHCLEIQLFDLLLPQYATSVSQCHRYYSLTPTIFSICANLPIDSGIIHHATTQVERWIRVYHILKSQIRQVDVPNDPLRILARGRMPEIKIIRDRGVLYFIHSCYIGVIGREQYTLSQVGLAMPHALGRLLLPGILRRFSLLVLQLPSDLN